MVRALFLGCALLATVALASSAAGGKAAAWPRPDARDRSLLASVLHGMDTNLNSVRLTRLGPEWRKGRRHGTLELVTTASVSRKAHVASIRADWDTLLIAHGYNERCVRHAAHCLSVAIGPRGGGGEGRSGARRPFWSAHALAHAIRSRFAAAGLRVTSIAFEHPHAFAPVVTVRSSHPRRAYKAERKAWVALLPTLRHSEGSFVKMFSTRGRLFFVSSGSGNTGEGWCAPSLHCPAP